MHTWREPRDSCTATSPAALGRTVVILRYVSPSKWSRSPRGTRWSPFSAVTGVRSSGGDELDGQDSGSRRRTLFSTSSSDAVTAWGARRRRARGSQIDPDFQRRLAGYGSETGGRWRTRREAIQTAHSAPLERPALRSPVDRARIRAGLAAALRKDAGANRQALATLARLEPADECATVHSLLRKPSFNAREFPAAAAQYPKSSAPEPSQRCGDE